MKDRSSVVLDEAFSDFEIIKGSKYRIFKIQCLCIILMVFFFFWNQYTLFYLLCFKPFHLTFASGGLYM